MAKCGCSGQACSCSLVAGAGVTVTGSGSVDNPFVVSARQLYLTTTDSATIDLTLTGAGTATNPYTLSGAFIGTIAPPDFAPSESQSWSGAVNLTAITAPRTIRATLNGNVTGITLPSWSSSSSGSITLVLYQDSVGSRTWVMPGTSAGGVDVVLSTAANARDVVRLFWTGVQWVVSAVALNVS